MGKKYKKKKRQKAKQRKHQSPEYRAAMEEKRDRRRKDAQQTHARAAEQQEQSYEESVLQSNREFQQAPRNTNRKQALAKHAELMEAVAEKSREFEQKSGQPYQSGQQKAMLARLKKALESKRTVTDGDIVSMGYTFKLAEYRPDTQAMRRALRIQFAGKPPRPNSAKFSRFFRRHGLRNNPPGRDLTDYNPENNRFLKALAKFPEYESYAADVYKNFAGRGIAPTELVHLQENDIYQVLDDVTQSRKDGLLFEGTRIKFLRTLATDYSAAMTAAFKARGHSDQYIESAFERMMTGIPPDGYNVHHKKPIGGSAGKGMEDVNELNNFVLIQVDPCHDMLHNYLDYNQGIVAPGGKPKVKWVNIPTPKDGVVFYGGPDTGKQVTIAQHDAGRKPIYVLPNEDKTSAPGNAQGVGERDTGDQGVGGKGAVGKDTDGTGRGVDGSLSATKGEKTALTQRLALVRGTNTR